MFSIEICWKEIAKKQTVLTRINSLSKEAFWKLRIFHNRSFISMNPMLTSKYRFVNGIERITNRSFVIWRDEKSKGLTNDSHPLSDSIIKLSSELQIWFWAQAAFTNENKHCSLQRSKKWPKNSHFTTYTKPNEA